MQQKHLATAKTVRPAAVAPVVEVAPAAPADVMLTKKQLAPKLKVSVRTIEEWLHEGRLPFIRISTVVIFYWPTVVAHLHTHYSVNPLTGEKRKAESGKAETSLPHPGPLPPAAAGRRGSRDAEGGSL